MFCNVHDDFDFVFMHVENRVVLQREKKRKEIDRIVQRDLTQLSYEKYCVVLRTSIKKHKFYILCTLFYLIVISAVLKTKYSAFSKFFVRRRKSYFRMNDYI